MTDTHSIGVLPHAIYEDEVYVLVPQHWVEWVCFHINRFIDAFPEPKTLDEQLQERADANRDNASSLFPTLTCKDGVWYDEDGDKIVFTPYGYRKWNEVQNELAHG